MIAHLADQIIAQPQKLAEVFIGKYHYASSLISKSITYIKMNKPEIKCLVSFTDTTYNHTGTIYRASNWKFDGKVAPSHWYVNSDNVPYHKKTIWDRAKAHNMTENEYATNFKLQKIIGSEKLRFIYYLDYKRKNNR